MVILIISHIIRIAAISCIGVTARLASIILCILRRVVGSWARGTWWAGGSCAWRLLSAAISAIRVLGGVALLAGVLVVVAVAALGWVFFEAVVLLFDICEEVFAEFTGALDFFWVRAAERGLSGC